MLCTCCNWINLANSTLNERCWSQKLHTKATRCMVLFIENLRIGNFIKTESRLVVSSGSTVRKDNGDLLGMEFLFGVIKMFKTRLWWWLFECVLVAQSSLTLCNPMDCSLPIFSVHGILQTRILGWVTFPSPGELPNPGIGSNPGLPHFRQIFYHLNHQGSSIWISD